MAVVTRTRVSREAAEVGKHFATWRKLLGYTSAQVAQRAGIARSTLSSLENGDASVSLHNVLLIARVLGISDTLVKALDPYDSDLGRASVDRVLPQRVRR